MPVTQCPGNRRWIQLAFDSFLLMQTAPSMVDARNAILAADQARFGGADQAEIWAAFARRGLGRFASQTNGSGRTAGVESDTNPLPDFEAPGQANANVTFAGHEQRDGQPGRSRRASTSATTRRASRRSPTPTRRPTRRATASANNLDETATFAPGTYEFIATAPGYGAVRFRKTFKANVNPTITLRFAPNYASTTQGAHGDGRRRAGHERRGTVVQADADGAQEPHRRLGGHRLAGGGDPGRRRGVERRRRAGDDRPRGLAPADASATSRSARCSGRCSTPTRAPTWRRTASRPLRQFEIWTCNDQAADCSQDDSYQRAYASASDAFPADAPRPVAPMMLLRNFTFSPVKATHLRIVVRNSQCTGGPAYQGEQDADPNNATDCNAAGPATTRFVRVAEVQAFGANSSAQG